MLEAEDVSPHVAGELLEAGRHRLLVPILLQHQQRLDCLRHVARAHLAHVGLQTHLDTPAAQQSQSCECSLELEDFPITEKAPPCEGLLMVESAYTLRHFKDTMLNQH